MPMRSKAQRRKFAELLVKGEISEEVYERWNKETGRKELPERVTPKSPKNAVRKTTQARKKTTHARTKTTQTRKKTTQARTKATQARKKTTQVRKKITKPRTATKQR